VDDEPAILRLVSIALNSSGFQTLEAGNASEAEVLFNASQVEISALVSDISMPGENGLTFAQKLREGKPGLPVVLTSGYPKMPLIPNGYFRLKRCGVSSKTL